MKRNRFGKPAIGIKIRFVYFVNIGYPPTLTVHGTNITMYGIYIGLFTVIQVTKNHLNLVKLPPAMEGTIKCVRVLVLDLYIVWPRL